MSELAQEGRRTVPSGPVEGGPPAGEGGRTVAPLSASPHASSKAPAARVLYLDVEPAGTAERRRVRPSSFWMLALVAVPMLAAAIYLAVFAADRYTSQTSFVIRAAGGQSATAGGLARNDDSSHAVAAYLQSRAMAGDLGRRFDLRAMFAPPQADVLTRYPRPWTTDSEEALHLQIQSVTDTQFDSRSGITTLSVLAYRAEDAQALALAMLEEAEGLVNRMNERASADAITFASGLVADGERRIRDVQDRISSFRNAVGLIDPGAQSSAQLTLVTELTQTAVALDTEIAQLRSSASQSPRLPVLVERRSALSAQIDELRGELAGSATSLAPQIGQYEILALERDLAVRSLTAAYRALEQARQEATGSQLYLERISAPNVSDRPSHPRILYTLALVLGVSLAFLLIVRSLVRSIMEHRF